MGDTLTALGADDGLRVCWVLCIEGYEALIVGGLDDPTDILNSGSGWNGLPWAAALGGLKIQGEFQQEIDPWADKIQTNSLTFLVQDWDSNDTFGKVVFKRGAGNQTELATAIDADDGSIVVVEDDNFSDPTTLYIGCERIDSADKGIGESFTTLNRGFYHPFTVDGGTAHRMGRNHTLPSHDFDVFHRPKITDEPRTWIGKWVSLHMHRVVGDPSTNGTIDTRANAQMVFSGKIAEIQDTEKGDTAIICDDVKSVLKDTTLLHDQFSGRVAEGIWLRAGWTFGASENLMITTAPPTWPDNDATALTVTDGAAGNNQIEDGYNLTDDLIAGINLWLREESDSDPLDANWSMKLIEDRVHIEADFQGGTDYGTSTVTFRAPAIVLKWLGFSNFGYTEGEAEIQRTFGGANPTVTIVADSPPYRIGIGFGPNENIQTGLTLNLDSFQGTWVNQAGFMPPPYDDTFEVGSDNIGFLLVGKNNICIARWVSDTQFTVSWPPSLREMFGHIADVTREGVRLNESGHLEVKQVVMLSAGIKTMIASLFASTGAAAYNHATYDQFPAQLGAAIPYELLDSAFEVSLDNLEASTSENSVMLILEKPTKLETVIMCELLVRSTHLIWKNEHLVFVRPQRPSPSGLALHILTEANKGGQPGDALRAPTMIDKTHLRNVFKLEYNRTLEGKYRDTLEVRFAASIDDYGESRPVTIKMRNSYGADSGTVSTVEANAADMIALVAPLYGRPIARLRRTIDQQYFENVGPGDLVTVTDSFVRDPSDGTRGLTAKPGTLIGHSYQWGDEDNEIQGEVDILFLAQDNVTYYCPTAQVASESAAGGVSTLVCSAHEHSEASEAVDASNFAASDEVRIEEVDPADEAAPDTYVRTITSVSTNDILVPELVGFDAAKTYRVVSQKFSVAAATQKTDAYLAAADLRIEDARDPYEYSDYLGSTAATANVATELPERFSDNQSGDGLPLTVADHRAGARMVNNLMSYKTAPQMPIMRTVVYSSTAVADWTAIDCVSYWIPPMWSLSVDRLLSIAPMMKSDDGVATASIRVTISQTPPGGTSDTSVGFLDPFKQLTFTTTANVWAIQTAQTVSPIVNAHGVGYVTVEAKISVRSGAAVSYRGLAEFRLKEWA